MKKLLFYRNSDLSINRYFSKPQFKTRILEASTHGKDVFYIVNNSINAGRQTLKANFLNKVNVRLTNIYGTQTMENAYRVGFNLSGGEAILLEVL